MVKKRKKRPFLRKSAVFAGYCPNGDFGGFEPSKTAPFGGCSLATLGHRPQVPPKGVPSADPPKGAVLEGPKPPKSPFGQYPAKTALFRKNGRFLRFFTILVLPGAKVKNRLPPLAVVYFHVFCENMHFCRVSPICHSVPNPG